MHEFPFQPGPMVIPPAVLWLGTNDGGIKRGDGDESGDNEAGYKDGVDRGGSQIRGGGGGATGNPTFDPSGLGPGVPTDQGVPGNQDDLEIRDQNDESLGISDKEDYY
jgi:hypothetical protein